LARILWPFSCTPSGIAKRVVFESVSVCVNVHVYVSVILTRRPSYFTQPPFTQLQPLQPLPHSPQLLLSEVTSVQFPSQNARPFEQLVMPVMHEPA
jgi:hypothetical protein